MTNSRDKGARGEREAAAELRRVLGIEARRGVQHAGGPDSPDIVTENFPVHIEVKRAERFELYGALAQATKDAGGKMPLVLHRRNHRPWVFVAYSGDLLALAVAVATAIGRPVYPKESNHEA